MTMLSLGKAKYKVLLQLPDVGEAEFVLLLTKLFGTLGASSGPWQGFLAPSSECPHPSLNEDNS
jgi:hypothetical protein